MSLRSDTTGSEAVPCRLYYTSPDYFDVYCIRPVSESKASLKEGIAARKVVITEDAAERLFPGREAVGQTVYTGNDNQTLTIGAVSRTARGSEFNKVSRRYSMYLSEADVKSFGVNLLPWAEVSAKGKAWRRTRTLRKHS